MRKTCLEKKLLMLLKSKRGGISGIVFEIVLSIVAITLLIMVISLFRGNMDIIGKSAGKSDELSKVSEESLIPLDKSIVKGSDVISVIRYYAEEEHVDIDVTMGPEQIISYEPGGEGFDISRYAVHGYSSIEEFRNLLFDTWYEYDGKKLVKVSYTKR
ncbi:MAG TPA: hypothetical protein VHP38_07285 [Ruminiclostridium sp.]|nr:hypothetical protein [Ruminiclostridium sp.]